ncbi:MAG: SPFH domain-containing protein [Candidatus Yanofskybacteria bacterium]|nr:SPFH domain-containing protein [Candidatus Yanofskybacteria bacterium]
MPEGEMGVKCRWGKAIVKNDGSVDVRGPGFVMLIPFIDTLAKRHVREQTINLIDQKVTLGDGFICVVSAVIVFKIINVYKALFAVDKLDNSIENVALVKVQERLNNKTYDELLSGEIQLSGEASDKLQEVISRWGVKLIEFGLTDYAVIPEQANLVSAQVGALIKLEALKSAAKELGLEDINDISPDLAAVLVGVPIVSTLASASKVVSFESVGQSNSEDDKKNTLVSMFKFIASLSGVGSKAKP